jgi:hypothetical protein
MKALKDAGENVEKAKNKVEKLREQAQKQAKKLQRSNKLLDIFIKLKNKNLKRPKKLTCRQQIQLVEECIHMCSEIVSECTNMTAQIAKQEKQLKQLNDEMAKMENSLLKDVKRMHTMLLRRKDPQVSEIAIYGQDTITVSTPSLRADEHVGLYAGFDPGLTPFTYLSRCSIRSAPSSISLWKMRSCRATRCACIG